MLGRMLTGLRVITWGIGVGYPLLMYWALTRYGRVGGAAVGLGGAVLWGLRAALGPGSVKSLWALAAVMTALPLLALGVEDERLLLLLPVMINAGLLATFASSLRGERTIVERVARVWEPELGPDKVRHCRQFTWVWVSFFLVNGTLGAVLAVAGALEAWTLYTSVVSYGLIAVLLLSEWVVRRMRFGGRGGQAHVGDLRP